MKRKKPILIVFLICIFLIIFFISLYTVFYFKNVNESAKFFIGNESWYFLNFNDFFTEIIKIGDIPFIPKNKINDVNLVEFEKLLLFIYQNSVIKEKKSVNLNSKSKIAFLEVRNNLFENKRGEYIYYLYLLQDDGNYIKKEYKTKNYNKLNKIILTFFHQLSSMPDIIK